MAALRAARRLAMTRSSSPRTPTQALLALSPLLAAGALMAGCVGLITEDGGGEDDEVGDTAGTTTGEDDTTGSTEGPEGSGTVTSGGEEEVTIYDIQGGVVPPETTVLLRDVVVTSPLVVDEENGGGTVFLEEPEGGQYSGISLYLWSEVAMGATLQPGDVVDVVGEYQEFFDVSQLVIKNPGDIAVTGSGPLPGPDVVAAADVARMNAAAEPWEGVRVQVTPATIAESNDGFGQWVLEGDALIGNLYVDPLPAVSVGGSFESITGLLHYTYGEFKVIPGAAEDLAGYTDPPEPMEDTEIYDIQMGMLSEGAPLKVEGAIASSGLTWSDDTTAAFFIQEPAGGAYSGIQVYVQDTTGLEIAPGDEVTVVGSYAEYFEMSQVVVADASKVTVTGSGPAPAPELIADPASVATGGDMAEQWEGVLISVEDVSVSNPDLGFGEFEVDGGLRIDDIFFAIADWTLPAMGASYASITGLLTYSFDNFKLSPRDNGDLVAN